MARVNYGGQALIEGVMMRGGDAIAVAFRNPDGRIVYADEPLSGTFRDTRWAKLPFVRGQVVLYETLVVGTRWLVRSASLQAAEEGAELGRGAVAIMLILTLAVGVGIFFLLPLFLASVTAGSVKNDLVQHLIEGLFRAAIFIGYLAIIAQAGDIKRVFQYHGAEHMTIHALEHGDPLVPAAVRRYPTAHPRCGTEFLVVVILLSIVAFSLVGRQSAVVMVGSRILLIPVIAMVGYELLRLGARYRANPVIRVIMWPGILVQRITTKQPTDDMIEVAIVSLEQALAAEGRPIPAGSSDIPRDPLELGSTGEAEPVVRAAEAGPVPERLPSEPPARDG